MFDNVKFHTAVTKPVNENFKHPYTFFKKKIQKKSLEGK